MTGSRRLRKLNGMAKVGTVYLVGAGPGDPGLLTLKGRDCLARADLVLYDGLVNPLVLRHTRGHTERTARASGPDGCRLDQDEINRRLIDAARTGQTVVRLKGGDPFIFGRGFEEAAALAAAAVPFEIVPGVTAATAAGVYAGISFTHREYASAVALVTGHEDPQKRESLLDYAELARFPGTLVFYMGLHRIGPIVAGLLSAGKPAGTPSAVICRATWPQQRTVTAPLAELPAAALRANLVPPSVIVVGQCVALRDPAAWFEHLPLFGRRIGITRPVGQAEGAIARCLELGADPVLLPTISILPPDDWRPVDAALARLAEFDWLVFTSVNGVQSLLDRLWETGGDVRKVSHLRIAAIGDATAAALAERQLRADVVPESFRAEALAEALRPHVSGKRVLWARASRGRDVLPQQLAGAGADVEQVAVYQNVDATSLPAEAVQSIIAGNLDWIALSSPSIARSLKTLLPDSALERLGHTTRLAAISPVTADAAREVGLTIATVAENYTWDGLFEAMVAAS
jgi:uroporphyrinogen III methyltransferase/synthase